MGGCSIFCECRWLPYYAIAGGKLSDEINHYRCQQQPREVETICQCKDRFCAHNLGRKLECTSACNTEHIGLSMEVYTSIHSCCVYAAHVTVHVAHDNSSSGYIDAEHVARDNSNISHIYPETSPQLASS